MRLLQITLIPDKSALQGFSLEESVWMDALFVCGIPDVLHVEILADIEKNWGKGREVKNEIRRLVKKLPEMQGVRLFSYNEIARGETQGETLPKPGQLPAWGFESTEVDGQPINVMTGVPGHEDWKRWEAGEFTEEEVQYTHEFRRRKNFHGTNRRTDRFCGVGGSSQKESDVRRMHGSWPNRRSRPGEGENN